MATRKLDFSTPHVLRNDAEYDAAVSEIDDLLDRNPPAGTAEDDRLEFLSVLVSAYDEKHYRFGAEPASPVVVVDFGARPLSMAQLQNLHAQLGIPAELL